MIDIINEIHITTLKEGGMTVAVEKQDDSFHMERFKTNKGYQVSICDQMTRYYDVCLQDYELELLLEAWEIIASEYSGGPNKTFIGSWRDPKTSTTYYDISILVDSLQEAVSLAKQYDQQAIYDWKNDTCIRITNV